MALTDDKGNVLKRYEYGPFGEPTVVSLATTQFDNELMFTGRRWDEESGLYYYRTRYYSPAIGRFTTRDSIGIWGDPANLGNPYAYVGNNPYSHVDPYGLQGPLPIEASYAFMASAGEPGPISQAWNSLSPQTRNRITASLRFAEGAGLLVLGLGATGIGGLSTGGSGGLASPVSVPIMWGGTLLSGYSLDVMNAAINQWNTGCYQQTYTGQAIEYVTGSRYVADATEMGISMLGGGFLGIRAGAARGSRAYLDDIVEDGAAVRPCPDVPGDYPPMAPGQGRGLGAKAPPQVTPGIQRLEGQYIDDLGRVQPWEQHYDDFGRWIERTDWNAANPAHGIADTHFHQRIYGPNSFHHGPEMVDHVPGVGPRSR